MLTLFWKSDMERFNSNRKILEEFLKTEMKGFSWEEFGSINYEEPSPFSLQLFLSNCELEITSAPNSCQSYSPW